MSSILLGPNPYSIVRIYRRTVILTPLSLPLLSRILGHLSPADLAPILSTNSAFYRAGIEKLHRRLRLGEHGPWPEFADWDPFPPSPLQRILSRSWLPHAVAALDIYAHSTRQCVPSASKSSTSSASAQNSRSNIFVTPSSLPPLPNLAVVRVHMTDGLRTSQRQRAFHTNGDQQFKSNAFPYMHLLPQCPALYRVRSRKLVALGSPVVYRDKPVTALPYGLLASIERYVMVLAPDAELLLADRHSPVPIQRARDIVADIANVPNARDVVVLFYTPHPAVEWHGSIATQRLEFEHAVKDTWAGRLFTELAQLIAQLPYFQHVKFVNAGAIDKYATCLEYWDAARGQDALERHFRRAMGRYMAEVNRESCEEGGGDGEESAVGGCVIDTSPCKRPSEVRKAGGNLNMRASLSNHPSASVSPAATPKGPPGDRVKVAQWVRGTTVDFVSMNEYLQGLEWRDEFEDEEITAWLRVRHLKRAAAKYV